MKNLFALLTICSLCVACRNTETKKETVKTTIAVIKDTEVNDVLSRAKSVSDAEFAGTIDENQLTDSLESIFGGYKGSVFLKSSDSTRSVTTDFYNDTLWLNKSRDAMYEFDLANTTYGMMQTNKYNRVLQKRITEKYYKLYLCTLQGDNREGAINSHTKWLKKIDLLYERASKKAAEEDGTMSLVTWSQEVDKEYLKRTLYYYRKIQKH